MKAQDILANKPKRYEPYRFGGGMTGEEIIKAAKMIRGHKHFMHMLFRCHPEDREIMYETIRPHLTFTPKALHEYEADARIEADTLRLPMQDINGNLVAYSDYRPGQKSIEQVAQEALNRLGTGEANVPLTCVHCTTMENFSGMTQVDCLIKARKAGWVWDKDSDTETCPTCWAARTVQ